MPLPIYAFAAALGATIAMNVSEQVPRLDVEGSCRAAARANATEDLALPQSLKNCLRDEEEARAELVRKWVTFTAADRARCVGETMAGGESPSYVDVLTCLQMTQEVEAENEAQKAPPRGASNKRRAQ